METQKLLEEKVVLVTGGGRGIGCSVARACALQGARVMISARTEAELYSTRDNIQKESNSPVFTFQCDVAVESEVDALIQETEEKVGEIYGLVCAAGIYGPLGAFNEVSFAEWRRGIEVNLFGSALCTHRVLTGMKKRRNGKIILFDGGGQGPLPNLTCYTTGKGGVLRFNESIAHEVAPFGVYVNAISPGRVNTKFLDDLLAAGPARVGMEIYQKGLQQRDSGGVSPELSAELCLFLLSESSNGLYGKVLNPQLDEYKKLSDFERISNSDIYDMRRVVDFEGNTRLRKQK